MHSPKPVVRKDQRGFTLVEMLTVVLIIIILAGLVMSTTRFVQYKGAISRAKGEISAMEAALENFKADYGVYPPSTNYPPTADAAKILYQALTGDGNDKLGFTNGVESSGMTNWGAQGKVYMDTLKPESQFYSSGSNAFAVLDPWGKPYKYATSDGSTNVRNQATFDLWSTAGKTDSPADEPTWVKNWD